MNIYTDIYGYMCLHMGAVISECLKFMVKKNKLVGNFFFSFCCFFFFYAMAKNNANITAPNKANTIEQENINNE